VQQADLSRREFVLRAAGTLASARVVRGYRPDLTAQQVAHRITSSFGTAWREKTIDGFKSGDPATVVAGIATTTMATLDVLRRAAAAGQNLVITQEPVFYSPDDIPGNRASDSVYLAKKSFIDEKRLVVWRFADHWNARPPNQSVTTLAGRLGWINRRLAGTEQIYQVPETSLGELTKQVRERLAARGGLRVVGQPEMRVRSVFVSAGPIAVPMALENLRRADVILAGEPREWEVVPYVLDTWSTDRGRGLIAVGRLVSEGPGAEACAAWIRTLVPEVRVEAYSEADPYWSPRS
jgi:putative NIF3 family GTP cyclohydrolase 1 type 2